MYTSVYSTIVRISKRWKQPRWPFTDDWIHKVWYIHAVAYYSTIKRKKMLTHASEWMNLENAI